MRPLRSCFDGSISVDFALWLMMVFFAVFVIAIIVVMEML